MELDPLKIGIIGASPYARGAALQVESSDGMDLAWRHEGDLAELKTLLKNNPIDVFVEASGNLTLAAEASLLSIQNHAHVILTDPRVDVTFGVILQAYAYQSGIIVTSDAGTPHGALASMIQEAHIMGFDTVQAGQISPKGSSAQLQYEMAALANGFAFRPPATGMSGPKASSPAEILSAFDLASYQAPHIDFVHSTDSTQGLYLIVKPKAPLSDEQAATLHEAKLATTKVGETSYFLLRRDPALGYFETPKAILGAAAGQATLASGVPSCGVYAQPSSDAQVPLALPWEDDLLPHALLGSDPLPHLWIEQRKIIESQNP